MRNNTSLKFALLAGLVPALPGAATLDMDIQNTTAGIAGKSHIHSPAATNRANHSIKAYTPADTQPVGGLQLLTYYTRDGDTIRAVRARFSAQSGVSAHIAQDRETPENQPLPAGKLLHILVSSTRTQ